MERDLSIPDEEVRFDVSSAYDGLRLDLFLKRQLPWRSRSFIQSVIRTGRIRVNGEWIKAGRRVFDGDVVTIELAPVDPASIRHDQIPLTFLYEDEHIAVIDKQPGLLVHPVSAQLYNTLINALHYEYRVRRGEADVAIQLGHRLDRNTSGVLLISKHRAVRRSVQDLFEKHRAKKAYFAIVHGRLTDDAGEIDAPLRSDYRERGGFRTTVTPNGAPSLTRYEVLERFPRHTFVRLEPKTGRTHRLRVHMKHLGHPMLCDSEYGHETELYANGGSTPLLDRQALHSCMLRFAHPVTNDPLSIESAPPADMSAVLEALRSGRELVAILNGGNDHD